MRLKSLEAQGFKSFADKTLVNFGDGITAIVGPNGSGKSNISDAIRWVMGEQSAKSLRSGNMQEVIFAGTQKRKPLGFAEVTLTIDNSDKALPIEYDEVMITRRVFRSGESEYFINKSSVRLRDIHELFMDTGVGRDGYSIIGQGKIAEIIGAKSEDRRQMFEEASGITKFRYRKEEAERKLVHTNDNILRVNDIISELENQVEPLKIQSEKAKKYLNLREELKVVEVNVSLENIEKYKKSLSEADDIYADISRSLDAVDETAANIEKDIARMFEAINENEKNTEAERTKQQEQNEVLAEYRQDIALLENRIQNNNESRERIKGEIAESEQKMAELSKTIDAGNEYLKTLEEKKSGYDKEASKIETELSELESITSSKSDVIEQINTELIEKLNQVSAENSKISNIQALMSSYNQRAETIERELAERSGAIDDMQNNIATAQEEFDKLNKELNSKKDEAEKAEAEAKTLAQKSAEKASELISVKNELTNAVSRKKVLDDLENSFDNYSRSVKSVMLAHKNGQIKGVTIHGTVASLLTVDKKYATAIDIALGSSVQNIVTQTEEDAKRAIDYLKTTKQGRATFLPVTSATGTNPEGDRYKNTPGFIGMASELVKYDKKFENIVYSLLSRIAVVDNIDNAIAMARKNNYKVRIVTLEGELLAPGGSMSGGSKNHTAGIFERAGEIATLTEKISKLTAQAESLEKECGKIKTELDSNTDRLSSLKAACDELSSEYIKKESDLVHAKEFLASINDAKNAIITEKEQISAQLVNMTGDIEKCEKIIAKIREEIADLEKRTELEKEGMSGVISKRDELAEKLVTIRMSINAVKKDIEIQHERYAEVNVRKSEIEADIARKNSDMEAINELNENLEEDISFKNEQIADLIEEIKEISLLLQENDNSRKKARDDIQQKQNELKDVHEQQLALQQKQGKAESRKAKAEADLENTINRLWDEYELTITTAESYRADVGSLTVAQKRITDLKNQIRALGNINIDSIEEYKTVSERYEFLTTQRDDLVSARHNLEHVIADITEIMKTQFTEKFKIINKNFGEVFTELFGGGKAQIRLTDPNDVLSGGVEIDVHPPGKAIKNMLQLSGGEQAFVSIALLFAILKVRPAPFCILDEIEAALDDVNVFRFADYLKKFTDKSQFIVVTHRRGTMEAANVLYGVTMQEQGVTKLLSMNIDDVVEEG